MRFAFVFGEPEREAQEVSSPEEHLIEAVLHVVFAGLDGAELRIRVADMVEDSGQSVAELHGLGRRVRYGGVVQ